MKNCIIKTECCNTVKKMKKNKISFLMNFYKPYSVGEVNAVGIKRRYFWVPPAWQAEPKITFTNFNLLSVYSMPAHTMFSGVKTA